MIKHLSILAASAVALGSAGGAQASHFYASDDGDVLAYFSGSSAAYNERLGLLINGVDTGILGLQNHSSSYGDLLNFGHAAAGDELTFYISVDSTHHNFYSDVTLNADGFDHMQYEAFVGDDVIPAGTFVHFEDQYGGGDRDYSDERFVFTNVNAVPQAPEPATWAMMLGGFGLVGGAVRRRRTVVAFG